MLAKDTHSTSLGYILWFFGFTGSHRFYYGKPITGILWFCTFGLFFIGWIVDFFLIPNMEQEAEHRFQDGPYSYNITWILMTFFGLFGIHRFYLGRWKTGLLWLCTGGLFVFGYLYDFCTLNSLISKSNQKK